MDGISGVRWVGVICKLVDFGDLVVWFWMWWFYGFWAVCLGFWVVLRVLWVRVLCGFVYCGFGYKLFAFGFCLAEVVRFV